MIQLIHTKNAADFVSDINANLAEMGSSATVDETQSASDLVDTLNEEFAGVNGARTLDKDDNAEDFVADLNYNFDKTDIASIDQFDSQYESEMADTVDKVNAIKSTADLILMVSTDVHYERQQTKKVEKDGTVYEVPLMNGYNIVEHDDTFSPMMSNHKEFIRRAALNGINIDAIVNLGDFFDGRRVDHEVNGEVIMSANDIVTEYIGRMLSKYKALSNTYNIPLIFAIGNHDDNYDEQKGWHPTTFQTLYDWFLEGAVDPVNKSTDQGGTTYTGGLDYYMDYDDAGIRVVVLFCQEGLTTGGAYNSDTNKANNWTVPSASYSFLVSCHTSLPSGYKILILSHTHPVMSRGSNGGTDNLMDFVSEHSDDFIGYLCGHQHSDWVRGYPIATISHVCGLRTGWRDLKDLWSVIVVDKTNEVIRLIRFGQNGAWSNRRSGDYLVHYNQTVLELNEDATLELSIDNTNVTWGMVSSSWATFATNPVRFASNFDAATQEPFPASEVLSMTPSQDNGSCTVEVIDQKADHPRCVTVYARNNSMVEYWHIKIPQLTT